MQEVSQYRCWLAKKLIPSEAGFTCLRDLVAEIKDKDSSEISHTTSAKLGIYAIHGSKAADSSLECITGGCEASVEMDPVMSELLAERSTELPRL